jgi:hypothetical protein
MRTVATALLALALHGLAAPGAGSEPPVDGRRVAVFMGYYRAT